MSWEVRQGHVLDILRAMPAESVHMVVTSPPYWGLRAYGTEPQVWGGDPKCKHVWGDRGRGHHQGQVPQTKWANVDAVAAGGNQGSGTPCTLCGAWRGELGAEPTPELYVEHLVTIFREMRRVMRQDATLWLNLGSSYFGSGRGPTGWNGIGDQERRQGFSSGGGKNPSPSRGQPGALAYDNDDRGQPGFPPIQWLGHDGRGSRGSWSQVYRDRAFARVRRDVRAAAARTLQVRPCHPVTCGDRVDGVKSGLSDAPCYRVFLVG